MAKIKKNATMKKGGKVKNQEMEVEIVKLVNGAAFAHELMQLSVELKGIVAVCHDDITDQMAIIISWG